MLVSGCSAEVKENVKCQKSQKRFASHIFYRAAHDIHHAMHVIALTHVTVWCMSSVDQCLMAGNIMSLDGSYTDLIATKRFGQQMSLAALEKHAAETSIIKQTP